MLLPVSSDVDGSVGVADGVGVGSAGMSVGEAVSTGVAAGVGDGASAWGRGVTVGVGRGAGSAGVRARLGIRVGVGMGVSVAVGAGRTIRGLALGAGVGVASSRGLRGATTGFSGSTGPCTAGAVGREPLGRLYVPASWASTGWPSASAARTPETTADLPSFTLMSSRTPASPALTGRE